MIVAWPLENEIVEKVAAFRLSESVTESLKPVMRLLNWSSAMIVTLVVPPAESVLSEAETCSLLATVGTTYSLAPRSGGLARGTPRWSITMPVLITPDPTTRLLVDVKATVLVGPPLNCNPLMARFGSPTAMLVPVSPVPSIGLLLTRSFSLPVKVGAVPPALEFATKSLTGALA